MGCNNSKGADTSAFSQPTTNLDDEEEAGLEQMLAYELEHDGASTRASKHTEAKGSGLRRG